MQVTYIVWVKFNSLSIIPLASVVPLTFPRMLKYTGSPFLLYVSYWSVFVFLPLGTLSRHLVLWLTNKCAIAFLTNGRQPRHFSQLWQPCIVWLTMAVEFFAYGSVPHIDVYVVATNAALSPHTCLQPHAPPEIVGTCSQRVKILPGKILAVCENKTGKNLTLCSCDKFGRTFFGRKFPATWYNSFLYIQN